MRDWGIKGLRAGPDIHIWRRPPAAARGKRARKNNWPCQCPPVTESRITTSEQFARQEAIKQIERRCRFWISAAVLPILRPDWPPGVGAALVSSSAAMAYGVRFPSIWSKSP